MFEVTLTITAPGLETAINSLSAAIAGRPLVATTAPQTPANPTQAGASAAPAPTVALDAPMVGPTAAYPSNHVPTNSGPTSMTSAPAHLPGPTPQPTTPAGYPAGAPLPASPGPQYTVDQIMAAGSTLMDSGKSAELINLLHSFGVQAVTALKPEQLGAFATALRQLGAQI